MRRFPRLFVPILAAVVALATVPAALAASGTVTTGQFLVAVAKAHRLEAADPAAAAGALRAAGYALPDLKLDTPLTEGTVASVGAALGLKVTTQNPQAPFSPSQVDAFLSSFGQELGNRQSATLETNTDPLTKGKGKKKGLTKSRTEPL